MEKCYTNFICSLRSDATKELYDFSISKFKAWMDVAVYADLLPEKIDDINAIRVLQDKIISYIEVLKKGHQAPMSIKCRLAGIKHFYVMNDIILNWPKIWRFVGETRKTVNDRIYTKDEIRLVLEKCDERKRVMLFLLLGGATK